MRKKMLFGAVMVLFSLASCHNVNSNEKAASAPAADSLTIAAEDATQEQAQEQEQKQEMEAAQAFVEKFYKEWDREDLLEYEYPKQHITPKMLQYLKDSYPFDCEGECLATWEFFYEGGGDVGGLISRQITARDASHVLVENKYENYEYDVLLTLVKDGDTFKIDSLQQERSEYTQ